jgi:DNA-binding LacI/PurR family transcriptional regulator
MSTVKEVAKHANVSTATVSRVLNDMPNVTADVRARVRKSMLALNFHPNRVARSLRTKGTQVIGLIISDIQNLFFVSLARGVEDICSRNGYSLILCNTDEDPERERLYLETMRAEYVAGIILASTSETGHDLRLLEGIPVVALDRLIKDIALDTVVTDNVNGAKQAVQHLLSLGHRRIGIICGQQKITTSFERRLGYEQALQEFGLAVDSDLIRYADLRRSSEGQQQAMDLLRLPDPPTAIFTTGTMFVLGTLSAIREMGLRIPQDVALVTFDEIPWGKLLNPSLTTVPQPTYELGQTAAEMLMARIADPERPPTVKRFDLELIIRESSGPNRNSAV